jgi:hypothetical protein
MMMTLRWFNFDDEYLMLMYMFTYSVVDCSSYYQSTTKMHASISLQTLLRTWMLVMVILVMLRFDSFLMNKMDLLKSVSMQAND